MRGRSSTPQGGNARPPGEGVKPVALATAAISIALFVPSRNELNIRALKSPRRHLLGRESVMGPHRVGRRRVILGQVLGALARGDDLEAGGAAPVDHFADERRLVAISERVDDIALRARRASSGPARASASTLTITNMLAARERGERMADARGGIAGRVDDDVDLRRIDQRRRVVGTCVAAVFAAAANERAAKRSDAHPVRDSVARARAGSRSAMPTT
jgi:hypothetical protein